MADPLGMFSGEDVALYANSGTETLLIGGITTDSTSINNNLVETTNRSSEKFRTYLDGAGTQSISHNTEVFYSTDEGFQFIFNAVEGRLSNTFFLQNGVDGPISQFNFIVSAKSDAYGIDSATSDSFTFEQNGAVRINKTHYIYKTADGNAYCTANLQRYTYLGD